MILFPNAKVNLGLNIVEKRANGYHNLESIFYPIPLHDGLETIQANQTTFKIEGKPIAGETEANLAVKAFQLLKQDYDLPPIQTCLYKKIPMGSGLGGGSADGAFMLKLLNELFELNLDSTILKSYADQLGSDAPFFIDNRPMFVSGTGNVMQPIDLSLKGYHLAIICPQASILTPEAYKHIKPQKPRYPVQEIIKYPIQDWSELLCNDFETFAVTHHPELQVIKEKLYQQGALYASMTGSGSAIYGIFKDEVGLTQDFYNYEYWLLKL